MIIDASVASHWFVETEFTSSARPFAALPNLVGPGFLLVETANVLYKRSRGGELPAERCLNSIEELGKIVDLIPDAQLLPRATRLALDNLSPVYDCLYLALALERREPLATADRRLAALARKLGVETQFVEPE